MVAGVFAELGVSPRFIEKLRERDIVEPTEIQKRVIPLLTSGKNLIFRSATGTGKTFAYLLPLFQRLPAGESGSGGSGGSGKGGGPLILICAPTLELCSQIKKEADFLLEGQDPPVKVNLLIGSANLDRQIEALKKEKPRVIVGNPGRLLLLARMKKLKLGSVGALVLDEGDRLFAEELAADTRELLGFINRDRQTAACSATISPQNRDLLLPFMGEGVLFEDAGDEEVLRSRIEHWAFFSEGRRKIQSLRSLLGAVKPKKALVFSGGGGQPGNIVSQLQYHRVPAAGLYGDMDKKNRKEAVDGFRSGKITVLVSSDLAARGLDIPGITHVIALDVPAEAGPYVHRAGRTGRAGRRGLMITIGDEEEMRRLARLEKKLGITIYPKVLYRGRVCIPEPLEEKAPSENIVPPGPAQKFRE
ncbi:MAG: DEAD/DEAH box helicase [Spirochaetaceae bacterium]|jgi:superfamily II DNA/RNA helicase|nr:DEAD/DEAH box helicase [Spirochaetaceae bacterium]